MKSYIQLTLESGSPTLVPLNSFVIFQEENKTYIKMIHMTGGGQRIKESIEEVIQKIEDAEAEYENLSYVGPEK